MEIESLASLCLTRVARTDFISSSTLGFSSFSKSSKPKFLQKKSSLPRTVKIIALNEDCGTVARKRRFVSDSPVIPLQDASKEVASSHFKATCCRNENGSTASDDSFHSKARKGRSNFWVTLGISAIHVLFFGAILFSCAGPLLKGITSQIWKAFDSPSKVAFSSKLLAPFKAGLAHFMAVLNVSEWAVNIGTFRNSVINIENINFNGNGLLNAILLSILWGKLRGYM